MNLLLLTRSYWNDWWAKHNHARYTRLSERARDSLSVAALIDMLLRTLPPTLLDQTPTMVMMSHYMDLPARTVIHALDQINSAIAVAHAASLGAIKEKSYISLVLEPTQATLEQFFRNRDDAYVPVAESFHQLHERLSLLVATVLGDDTTESHLSAYQQRALYPLLDSYRTWLLTLNRLRGTLTPRPV
jgi:hypothetical protein